MLLQADVVPDAQPTMSWYWRQTSNSGKHYTGWSDVTLICGRNTTSMLWATWH